MGSHRVLVGFGESLAAIEATWCLIDHGYDVVAFTREGRRPALARDPPVTVRTVPAPEDDLAAATKAVAELLGETGAQTVMPFDDAAVVVLDALEAEGV